jgi:hypothetical protein
MFFVPGTYPDASLVFERFDGYSLPASGWADLVGCEADILALSGKHVSPKPRPSMPVKKRRAMASNAATDRDLDLTRSRLVSDAALDNYRSPAGSFHHARFALMMSMAGRAQRFGIAPTAEDLRSLFNQIDHEDGGYYQTPDHQSALLKEAQKVLSST